MSPEEYNAYTRSLIVNGRGGVPEACDFCGKATNPDDLHPEEAGQWVCVECLKGWGDL